MQNFIPQQIKLTLQKIKCLFIQKDPQDLYFQTVSKKQAQIRNKGITKALVAFSSHVQKQGPPIQQQLTTSNGMQHHRKVYAFNSFDEKQYDENPNFPHNFSFEQEKTLNTSEIRDQRVRKLKKKIIIQQFKNKRNSGGGFGYGFQEGRENQNDNSAIINYQQEIDDLLAKKDTSLMNKKYKKKVKQHNKYVSQLENRRELIFDKEPIKIRQQSSTASKSCLDKAQHQAFSRLYESFHSLSQRKSFNQSQLLANKEKMLKEQPKMSLKQILSKVKRTTKIQSNERKTEPLVWDQGIRPDFHPQPIQIKRPNFLDLIQMNEFDQ